MMKKILATNKTVDFNYEILDKIEAGIVLEGWEVISIKSGHVNLTNSYVQIKSSGIVILSGVKISMNKGTMFKEKSMEDRDRKLLLNKREILKLKQSIAIAGNTCVPKDLHLNEGNLIKVELAVVRGRKKYDKRAKLRERDIQKRINQDRKTHNF